MITKKCDHCETLLEFDDDQAGMKVRCPNCGDVNIVPDGPADRASAAGLPPDSGPEQQVMTLRPSMWRSHPFWTIFTLGIVTFFMWLRHLGERITITNKRTIYRTGFFSKSTTEVLHDHVRNITIDQGLIDRIFKVGNMGIASSGQEGIEIFARRIPHPDDVKRVIDLYRPL